MDQATDELKLHYDEFGNEFRQFFEDVQRFSDQKLEEISSEK